MRSGGSKCKGPGIETNAACFRSSRTNVTEEGVLGDEIADWAGVFKGHARCVRNPQGALSRGVTGSN
jgi:hypothetical protein